MIRKTGLIVAALAGTAPLGGCVASGPGYYGYGYGYNYSFDYDYADPPPAYVPARRYDRPSRVYRTERYRHPAHRAPRYYRDGW